MELIICMYFGIKIVFFLKAHTSYNRNQFNIINILFFFSFFYTHTHKHSAYVEDANLKDFFKFKDKLNNSCKTSSFKEAVRRIEAYISDPEVSRSMFFMHFKLYSI